MQLLSKDAPLEVSLTKMKKIIRKYEKKTKMTKDKIIKCSFFRNE